jgi:uncharacterized membrane protein YfcA
MKKLVFLLFFTIPFFAKGTTLPSEFVNYDTLKQEKYKFIKPFNKTVKWSLIGGAVLMPVGSVIANISVNPLTLFAFTEFLGGLIGFLGICLVAFGLLFWLGRSLVRRHFRLPKNRRRRQWLVYLGGVIVSILLGFLLVLEVPFWFK